jgi:hypothetical protein
MDARGHTVCTSSIDQPACPGGQGPTQFLIGNQSRDTRCRAVDASIDAAGVDHGPVTGERTNRSTLIGHNRQGHHCCPKRARFVQRHTARDDRDVTRDQRLRQSRFC